MISLHVQLRQCASERMAACVSSEGPEILESGRLANSGSDGGGIVGENFQWQRQWLETLKNTLERFTQWWRAERDKDSEGIKKSYMDGWPLGYGIIHGNIMFTKS